MKADHATWETGLVIPENTKTVAEQTLDVMLRIEALLEQLLGQRGEPVEGNIADLVVNISPTKTPFLEAGAGALLRVTDPDAPKPPKGKKATNGK